MTAADKNFMLDETVALCMMQIIIHNGGFSNAKSKSSDMIKWLEEYRNCIDDAINAVKATDEVQA